ncbi:MAG: type IV pilus biogenesis/stability protein PilW [Bacillota bacterium]
MTHALSKLIVVLLAGTVLAGCVTQRTVETRQVSAASTAPATNRKRAEAHTMLAAEYFQRGNFTVALQETRTAISEDPTYVAAHNMQGLVFMELREDGPAREAFDRAMRLDPNNPDVLNNFGWFLCVRDDMQRGMELILRAAGDARNPSPEKALLSAGLCMRREKKDAEAEQYFRRAVLLRPDLIGALFNLAAITYERGAMKDAENYLTRYVQLTQPSLDALILGVKISRATGDRITEDSYLQQLRRRFPDAPQAKELLQEKK